LTQKQRGRYSFKRNINKGKYHKVKIQKKRIKLNTKPKRRKVSFKFLTANNLFVEIKLRKDRKKIKLKIE